MVALQNEDQDYVFNPNESVYTRYIRNPKAFFLSMLQVGFETAIFVVVLAAFAGVIILPLFVIGQIFDGLL